LHISTKHEELYFWGKINGEENDYFIAFGINYKNNYGFPKKIFYYAPSNTYKFEILPDTYKKTYWKSFKGKPDDIIKKYKEENQENEINQEQQQDNKENEIKKIEDPDASVDDNAPKKEPPKENYTEKLKLSYIVKQIDIDTCIIPKGALKLTSEHEYRINNSFKGIKSNELLNENNYLHFRPSINNNIKLFIENIDSIFSYNILDPITLDPIKGCWSIQLDSTKKKVNLRNLLWPGFYAVHQSNTNLYGCVYFGDGKKNADLPFMI
jgi:radial spoke head protein 9